MNRDQLFPRDISATKVAIMIPTYNQEEFIRDAVESALMQTYPNLEVIVGDDASTDSTYEIVTQIDDKRLKIVRNAKNLGRTHNYRNLLYNHATGDFVVNLDGDDYYTDPDFIADAVNLINGDPQVVLVEARARWSSSGISHLSEIPNNSELSGLEILKGMPNRKFFFQHMASLYRRDVALDLDFYRFPGISSDWESLYRLVLRGKIRYLNKIVGTWRIHGENETASVDYDKSISNLTIWLSVFGDAVEVGMSPVLAKFNCAKCITYFASIALARLSLLGSKTQVSFVLRLMKGYPLSFIYLLIHPFYCIRIFLGFSGYYRLRKK